MKIVHPGGFELEFQDLASFICNSKRKGWASGEKPIKFTDGSEGYKHIEGNLFYRDSYIGEGNFIGQEVVFLIQGLPAGNIPLWGMNYSDVFRIPPAIPLGEAKKFKREVFDFLKEQLRNVPVDFPFRGPTTPQYRETRWGTLNYFNPVNYEIKDDRSPIIEFSANEQITLMPKPQISDKCFEFRYHGRILVPDSYIQS